MQIPIRLLLIGADGLHSKTRAALNGKTAPVLHPPGRLALHHSRRSPATPPVAEVHMGAGRHLVSYPLRGGTLRNIVAVEERNAWVEESWSLRDDSMEMKLAFADFSPRVQGWLERAQDVYVWGLFRHPVAQSWTKTLPEGAAAILGDAAHPTLPFLAQGASMALEDAWLLADRLAKLPAGRGACRLSSRPRTALHPHCRRRQWQRQSLPPVGPAAQHRPYRACALAA